MTRDDVVLFVLVALALVGKASPQSAACVLPCRHQSRPCFVSVVRGGFAAQFGRRAGRSVAAGASCSVSPVLWGTPQRTPSGCKLLGRSLLIARTTPRSCCVLRAGPEANEADAAGDDLGVLLRAWGVDDARLALEANGFTTVQRVRDVLEVDDLPELGLPLATRKILARLIKHLADGKRVEAEAELAKKVAGHLETGSTSNEFRDDEAGREAAAVAAAAAKQKQKEVDVLYNSEATKTRRRWEPFHRAVSEKMAAEAGNFQLRGIEEIELDAPINDEALDTSLMPRSEEDDELPDTVSLSSERGGGRFGTARRRMLAPPPPPEPGKKTKRHFRYRSREGDFFVKVVLTGEPTDDRCEQQKEDDAGNLMSMFMDGNLEDGDFDLGDLDKLKGLDLGGDSGVVIGAGGAGGGLILDIPDSLKLDLFGEDKEARKGLKYPHNLYEGEQQSLGMLRRTGQMRAPAPIVAGDLLDPDYVANHRMDAGRPRSDLVSGGFGVLEWVELDRNLNPLVVSDVAQQLARVHLSSEGMSRDYGFSINTFLGERELDNTIKSNVDILDFFCTRRLEPEIDAASRSSAQRASKISPKLLDEIGTKGFKVIQRLQESEVWRDLVFAPAREQGPRLLHGDLWLGNMAVDTERQAHVVGPASWFGPSDFDLAVGETFGMPERFKEAYHHYCPPLEAHKERSMLYRLYVLLNHLNQPASYQYSSNVGREPLFHYDPTDNFLGSKTLTSFRTTSLLNPGKHSYRSEMEMITRGGWFDPKKYAKQVLALLDDIIALAPPKSGSQGQIFKLWGTSTPDRRANRIDPPDGIKIIPFGYGDTKTKNRKYKDR